MCCGRNSCPVRTVLCKKVNNSLVCSHTYLQYMYILREEKEYVDIYKPNCPASVVSQALKESLQNTVKMKDK